MLKEKISGFIDKIRSIGGVAACALVSRDGMATGKYFDRDLNEPWSGTFLATILSTAESVGGIIRMKSLESKSIHAPDSSVMVVGAGENFLIAAIISDRKDPVNIQNQMLAVAQTIGESM
jgi:predicted regulator of Ras-like GTPase activity (Roadblock/LC7/MglB family)